MTITHEDLLRDNSKERYARYKARHEAQGVTYCMRDPDTVVSGVLTTEQAQAELIKPHSLMNDCGVTVFSNRSVFFITDDAHFAWGLLKARGFIPGTFRMPQKAAPRPAIPDGVIDTVAKVIAVYFDDELQLNTIEELLAYLNHPEEKHWSESVPPGDVFGVFGSN